MQTPPSSQSSHVPHRSQVRPLTGSMQVTHSAQVSAQCHVEPLLRICSMLLMGSHPATSLGSSIHSQRATTVQALPPQILWSSRRAGQLQTTPSGRPTITAM